MWFGVAWCIGRRLPWSIRRGDVMGYVTGVTLPEAVRRLTASPPIATGRAIGGLTAPDALSGRNLPALNFRFGQRYRCDVTGWIGSCWLRR
jgi:hypothetical protein